jgi:hypothetical protein
MAEDTRKQEYDIELHILVEILGLDLREGIGGS